MRNGAEANRSGGAKRRDEVTLEDMQWRDAEQRNEKRIDAMLGRRSSGTEKQAQGRAKAESAGTGLLVPLKKPQ